MTTASAHDDALARMDDRRGRSLSIATASRQAHLILRTTFAVMPIVTGIDKFFDRLTDWSIYAAPFFVAHSPVSVDVLMRVAAVGEIGVGILVAIRPRLGALLLTAWLVMIAINLIIAGAFADVALRDLGLAAAALALNRLSIRRH